MAKTSKFYTVSGFCRINGCIDAITYGEIFTTQEKAAKFAADEINQVISDEEIELEPVKPSANVNRYRISAYNDRDDIMELNVVEHSIEPIHAVVTFDQDDRTLNITKVNDLGEAQERVAKCAKAFLADSYNNPEYVNVNRDGNCDIEPSELRDYEPYVQIETTGGNFTAWTAVEIPVFGKADIDVQ